VTPTQSGVAAWQQLHCFMMISNPPADGQSGNHSMGLDSAGCDDTWTFVLPPSPEGAYLVTGSVVGFDGSGVFHEVHAISVPVEVGAGVHRAFSSTPPVAS
jgi:hypothetical protein